MYPLSNDEINALKYELAQLKNQFSARINNLEFRIAQLDPDAVKQMPPQALEQSFDNTKEVISSPIVVSAPELSQSKEVSHPKTQSKVAKQHPTKPRIPSVIDVFFSTLMSSIFDWFSPVISIYQSYKARGMLGIFALTVLGIGLTLAGFGYLMQLLIDQLEAGAKSLLMLSAAIAVMTLGVVIRRKTRFDEFAAAIVSLGLLLLYSTVYFAGSVYHVIPLVAVVVLYLIIAFLSHAFALWLNTKVVASLGIVGIALMPILSDILIAEPTYYLLSLALVTISSLLLAYRYLGSWLANLSLAFVLVALEWVVSMPDVVVSALTINVFYLVFFGYVTASLLFNKIDIKHSLVFLSALVGTNLLFFFQATDLSSLTVIFAFVINSAVAAGVSLLLWRLRHVSTYFMVLVAAIWLVFAIVSVFSSAYWSAAWAIEGLLLMYLGRRWLLPLVVQQGQVLAGISLIVGIVTLVPYFPAPALQTIDGWLLSVVTLAVMALWARLIIDNTAFNLFTQHRVKPTLLLAESVWGSIVLLGCGMMWLGEWVAPVTILLQAGLLFRARMCRQTSIEIFAMSLIILPVLYAVQFAIDHQIYRFSDLALFAKLSLLSVLAQLWLFAEYYRRFSPDSWLRRIAEGARLAFYLIVPICWVGSAARRLEEELLMVIWLSPLLASLFAYKVKHRFIRWQAKILVGVASVLLALGISFLSPFKGVLTVAMFGACFGMAYYLNSRKGYGFYQYIASWGVLSLGMTLPIGIANYANELWYGCVFAVVYWSSLLLVTNQWWLARRHALFISFANTVLLFVSWLLTVDEPVFAVIPALFILMALYQKQWRFFRSIMGLWCKGNADLLLHGVAVVSYLTLLTGLDAWRLDLLIAPVLAVHGAAILFIKNRRLVTVRFSFGLILLGIIKLGLIDAANAVLWQKVMLFMGIGIFILGASFWYQRLASVDGADTKAK